MRLYAHNLGKKKAMLPKIRQVESQPVAVERLHDIGERLLPTRWIERAIRRSIQSSPTGLAAILHRPMITPHSFQVRTLVGARADYRCHNITLFWRFSSK